MNPCEEVVCETVEAFKDACWKHGAFIPAYEIKPGEESTGFKNAPVLVRIVYRPSPPSPALSGPLCPRCGAVMDRIELGLNIESWRCRADGMFHPFTPPPPRDEAEDAFRKWAMSGGAYALDRITFTDPDMDRQYRAFLAGRASVKP